MHENASGCKYARFERFAQHLVSQPLALFCESECVPTACERASFAPQESLFRITIKALLRRKQVYTCGNMKENGQNVWIKKGDLKINTTGNKVFSGDEEIYLTETEYEILSLMLKYRGKIFSVQNIYESVWQEPFFNNSANTVMVHIRKLRLKIEKNPQKPQIIQTVWGKGYRIE